MLDIASNICVSSLQEAFAALEADEKSILVAGGTDVLIGIREGKYPEAHLISIGSIPELKGVSRDPNGNICIGPLTTFRELEEDPIIRQYVPILAQAAGTVGGPQIRAAGTIGGNICNGATSADTASSLCALDALLTIRTKLGTRTQSIHEHYLGPGKVALKHNEILTAIVISQKDYAGYTGAYKKFSMRNAMDIATLGCALWMQITAQQAEIKDIRIACGVAAPTPMRARRTEQALRGMHINQAGKIGPDLLRQEITPRDSWRASKAFRKQIAGEMLAQMIKEVIEQEEIQCYT